MKLSSQDRRDLDKYTKFLALKATQIIIQSRMGDKVSTVCKPETKGTDWFNLNVTDLPDVLAETRKALNIELISTFVPLCVEISLCTSEGDQMVLESWCLSLLPEQQCDPELRIVHTIYNRMGVLLKSLVSVTRVTPAYKLSRRQGPESYVICYRVYMDQPQLHSLGDGYKQVRIGQICTPIGTLQCSVAYRTKMTISPTQAGKNNSIMLKSDHFNSNSNPRKNRNNFVSDDDIDDLSKPMKPGPFANNVAKVPPVEPLLPGIGRLLAMSRSKPRTKSESSNETSSNNNEADEDSNESKNDVSPTPSVTLSKASTLTLKSTADDEEYWSKELNAPFARTGPVKELMQFYKQCKRSPPLPSPPIPQSPEEINHLLDVCESQLPEYDALVSSFCESPDKN